MPSSLQGHRQNQLGSVSHKNRASMGGKLPGLHIMLHHTLNSPNVGRRLKEEYSGSTASVRDWFQTPAQYQKTKTHIMLHIVSSLATCSGQS